jgi:MFS superfamily sulfate permease-like transporter
VALSIAALLSHMRRPSGSVLGRLPATTAYAAIEHEPTAETEPGLLIYRLDAPLLFINAKRLRDGIREQVRDAEPPVRIVLLDLSFSHEVDVGERQRPHRALARAPRAGGGAVAGERARRRPRHAAPQRSRRRPRPERTSTGRSMRPCPTSGPRCPGDEDAWITRTG